MKTPHITHILIIGAGTMGVGIAKSFAQVGINICLLSRRPPQLPNLPDNIKIISELPSQIPDLIIESVVENISIKQEVYAKVEAAYAGKAILGTNTSGLPLEELSTGLKFPEKFIGIHYFMPAEVFPMVEIMVGPKTSTITMEIAIAAIKQSGKDPIVLHKPIVGYLINRLQHAILHEAYYLIESGIASVSDVDKVAKSLLGPRMCITGLIEQKDISGVNTHVKAHGAIVPHLAHTNRPAHFLQELASHNENGIKTGKGFYDWEQCNVDNVNKQALLRLQNLLHYLKHDLQPTLEKTKPQPREFRKK